MSTLFAKLAVWVTFGITLVVLPLVFDTILGIAILSQMGVAVLFAMSYNMLLGQGGMLSFGHAVYFGVGGFIAVHFLNFMEDGAISLPLPMVPLIGGLSGLLLAVLIGSFSTRRAGTVFAMISLGIGELLAASSRIFIGFFGGEEGVTGDRTWGPTVFGSDFARSIDVYWLIAFWVFVAILLMYLWSRTPVGRMANAVRDNFERAEFVGYSVRAVRFMSFCAAGLFAGIAGGLFAINYEILTEENLNLASSGEVLLMAYVGGTGFFVGPVIGAVLFTLLQSLLSSYTDIWQLYIGLVFVLTVLFVPTGLTGLITMHGAALRLRRLHLLVIPYIAIGSPVLVMLVSLIGILEMTWHLNESLRAGLEMTLMGVTIDPHSWQPWTAFTVLAALSVWFIWRQLPSFRLSWQEASHDE